MRTLLRTQLRPMSESDLAQIAEIERESFVDMWPQTAYKRELQNTAARYLVLTALEDGAGAGEAAEDRRATCARCGGGSAARRRRRRLRTSACSGFVGLWLMVGEAHIVTFAVREEYRRMGIGERLLLSAFECAMELDQACVTLEVRSSNEAHGGCTGATAWTRWACANATTRTTTRTRSS